MLSIVHVHKWSARHGQGSGKVKFATGKLIICPAKGIVSAHNESRDLSTRNIKCGLTMENSKTHDPVSKAKLRVHDRQAISCGPLLVMCVVLGVWRSVWGTAGGVL